MRRQILLISATLAAAATLGLSACGGSSSTPSSSGPGSSSGSQTSPPGNGGGGGGSFCDQARAFIAQGRQLFSGTTTSPGATPSVDRYKQLIATLTSAVDQLDGQAPAEIATSFHTIRAAYDEANVKAQAATTLQDFNAAFSNFDTPAIKAAGKDIDNYAKNTCGINSSASP